LRDGLFRREENRWATVAFVEDGSGRQVIQGVLGNLGEIQAWQAWLSWGVAAASPSLLLSWLFLLVSVVALLQLLRAVRWPMNRAAYLHSLLVALANGLAAGYLLDYGVIGLRTGAY
jgi:hypothetical protein